VQKRGKKKMVYQRYVLINGKKYGPYIYRSIRKGKKVLSIYVRKADSKNQKKRKNE